MKGHIKLFVAGYLQVLLVAISTYQIAHGKYIGAFVAAFSISLFWSYNVKRVAFGTLTERIVYAAGAAAGSVSGMAISELLYK